MLVDYFLNNDDQPLFVVLSMQAYGNWSHTTQEEEIVQTQGLDNP